ncbi:MAG: hypothetical protein P1U90_12040 [Akkermansiaceae bacterium]|nr:hypothetical protein [Akkermansiaceae bacterium]
MPDAFHTIAQVDEIIWARPLSTAALIAIFAGIVVLSIFVYRKGWGLPLWLRVFLAVSRILVLALIVATLLEPTAVRTESQTRVRSLPVLLDISESMSMKDQRKRPGDIVEAAAALGMVSLEDEGEAERLVTGLDTKQRQAIASSSRLDLGQATLTNSGKAIFDSLGESMDLSYHLFGQSPRLVSDQDLKDLKATEPGTSIASSLEDVSNSGGLPPAAIVLLTDGIDNASAQRSEAVLQDLGARGIPVYAVPLGLADPDDVAIRNIVMQEVAFSGDSVPVRVHLESRGYERRTARLAVSLNGRRVTQKTIRFTGGLQFEDIDFRVDVYEKGAAQIAITVEPFDDEVSIANNSVERSIRVVNEKINVLYIEGNARWEFRYLHAILKRDPRINATFIASNMGPELARNSPEHIERFPVKRDEAFNYDLVILGDVDADFFTPEELGLLEELIRDRGGSLLVLCGPMHTPASYVDTPVETMLPVRFAADEKWEEVSDSVFPVLTPEGRNSMVMTLENDKAENDRTWSRVAPLDHLPPLLGPKQGATVLAALSDENSSSQRYPLVAWQRYGTGKCLSIATDRLWRLRFKTGDKYHWRVWSQCIQFMTLSRLMGEHKRIRLETDRSIYPLADQSRIYAHVLDDEFEPVVQSGFEVVVAGPDDNEVEQRIKLQPDRSHPGLYEGYFTPPAAGRYRIEANDEDKDVSNTTEFQVADFRKELTDTNMRSDHLERIAELTGGAKLSVRDLPQLQSLINTDPVTTTVRSERPLWDNSLIVFSLVGLLGVEWIIRRRHDLP